MDVHHQMFVDYYEVFNSDAIYIYKDRYASNYLITYYNLFIGLMYEPMINLETFGLTSHS